MGGPGDATRDAPPIPARVVRSLEVSAASGLVLRGGRFHVVADDEHALQVFGPDGAVQRVALLPDALPDAPAARKAGKADFEILLDLPGLGLLAMGSGSRPARERAVLLPDRGERRLIDTAPLCARLRGTFPDLNLEGAALLDDALVLLQRGNRRDPRNALVFVARQDLWRARESGRFEATGAPRIVTLALGAQGDVPWSCTDLASLQDGGLLASGVLEDTCSAYDDGRCLGSSLLRLAPDGTLRWHRRLEVDGKVEGLAVDGEDVWLVTDADDRSVPARLLRATLP